MIYYVLTTTGDVVAEFTSLKDAKDAAERKSAFAKKIFKVVNDNSVLMYVARGNRRGFEKAEKHKPFGGMLQD